MPTSEALHRWACLLGLALMFGVGVQVGRALERPAPPRLEGPAPEVRKPSGALVLARDPAPEEAEDLEAEEGAPVIRRALLEALPTIPGQSVTVELLAVQTPQGIRVEARSTDGKILGGLDQPIRPIRGLEGPPRPWTVQAIRSWGPDGGEWGALVSYRRGPWVASIGGQRTGAIFGIGVQF